MITGIGGTALIAYAVINLQIDRRATARKEADAKEVLDLAAISRSWQDAVKNRHASAPQAPAPVFSEKRESPPFRNPEIAEFYHQVVSNKRLIKHPEWTVICRILELLDKYGGCPSVVCNSRQYSSGHDLVPDAIDLLAHIPLWQHSLAVATKILETTPYQFLAGRDLIVALAHDIGKIPEFHTDGYASWEHPIIATSFLRGIPEFNNLPNNAELIEAVRDHHTRVRKHSPAERLKKSDQEVRRSELVRLLDAELASQGSTDQGNDPVPSATHKPPEHQESVGRDPNLTHFDENADTKPLLADISGWFNAEKIIDVIKENVNQVTGGWWNAVSTPDGYVFCCAKGLFNLLHRAFPRQSALLAAYANAIARHDILYTVVMTLAREYDAVATEHLSDGEYLCPVSITTGSNKTVEGKRGPLMMVPFRAKALGLSSYQLEVEKSQTILRMVKSIVPLTSYPEGEESDRLQADNSLEQAAKEPLEPAENFSI